MTNPMIRIHNAETQEVIDREMTAEELVEWQAWEAGQQAKLSAEATKAAEKAALLERLGITADEAALLLS
jgi:hypothetical protein